MAQYDSGGGGGTPTTQAFDPAISAGTANMFGAGPMTSSFGGFDQSMGMGQGFGGNTAAMWAGSPQTSFTDPTATQLNTNFASQNIGGLGQSYAGADPSDQAAANRQSQGGGNQQNQNQQLQQQQSLYDLMTQYRGGQQASPGWITPTQNQGQVSPGDNQGVSPGQRVQGGFQQAGWNDTSGQPGSNRALGGGSQGIYAPAVSPSSNMPLWPAGINAPGQQTPQGVGAQAGGTPASADLSLPNVSNPAQTANVAPSAGAANAPTGATATPTEATFAPGSQTPQGTNAPGQQTPRSVQTTPYTQGANAPGSQMPQGTNAPGQQTPQPGQGRRQGGLQGLVQQYLEQLGLGPLAAMLAGPLSQALQGQQGGQQFPGRFGGMPLGGRGRFGGFGGRGFGGRGRGGRGGRGGGWSPGRGGFRGPGMMRMSPWMRRNIMGPGGGQQQDPAQLLQQLLSGQQQGDQQNTQQQQDTTAGTTPGQQQVTPDFSRGGDLGAPQGTGTAAPFQPGRAAPPFDNRGADVRMVTNPQGTGAAPGVAYGTVAGVNPNVGGVDQPGAQGDLFQNRSMGPTTGFGAAGTSQDVTLNRNLPLGRPNTQTGTPSQLTPQQAAGLPMPGPMNAATGQPPQGFIFHHTGGRGDVQGVQNTLRQRGLGVEYVMDRDGRIYRTGNPGASQIRNGWGVGTGLNNRNTVGMEVIARDNRDVTPAQVAAAQEFMRRNYPNTSVYGHGEVNPGHKEADEGMAIVSAIRGQPGRPREPTPPTRQLASIQNNPGWAY